MPDPATTPAPSQTFSIDYVKELRSENAQWRTKLREMEANYAKLEANMSEISTTSSVLGELSNRGIKANPTWITLKEGQSVSDAVDNFITEYPQFALPEEPKGLHTPNRPGKPTIPHANKREQQSNTPSPGERTINELKEDPKARSQVREQYRQMLAGKNNTI